MFGLGQLGKLGSVGRALAAWTPAQLWPLGATSPGMWTDPPYTASLFQDSAGTTAISAIGTVLDTSNPVGLALDRKGNLELGPELVTGTPTNYGSSTVSVVGDLITVTSTGGGTSGVQWASSTVQNAGVYSSTFELVSSTTALTFQFYTNTLSAPAVFAAAAPGIKQARQVTVASGGGTDHVVITVPAMTSGESFSVRLVSVREIPGIHLSQATGTSRPVASALVNTYTKSQEFTDTSGQGWARYQVDVATDGTLTPDGRLAAKVTATGATDAYLQKVLPTTASVPVVVYYDVKAATSSLFTIVYINQGIDVHKLLFNLSTLAITSLAGSATGTIELIGDGFYRCTLTKTPPTGNNNDIIWAYPGTAGSIAIGDSVYLSLAQLATAKLPYQRVTTASDYDASAGPTYLQFDGVDDSLTSATFAAGTISGLVDCLIAVRRDSAANVVLISESGGVYFGAAIGGGGAPCNATAGSATVWVDGTQLTGGTSVTQATLETALTPGAWHIAEFRGLNLSLWTLLRASGYGGSMLNGAISPIQLFASGQDANRDLARAQMAAYFGVTLP